MLAVHAYTYHKWPMISFSKDYVSEHFPYALIKLNS